MNLDVFLFGDFVYYPGSHHHFAPPFGKYIDIWCVFTIW